MDSRGTRPRSAARANLRTSPNRPSLPMSPSVLDPLLHREAPVLVPVYIGSGLLLFFMIAMMTSMRLAAEIC